jgi:YggT family protein
MPMLVHVAVVGLTVLLVLQQLRSIHTADAFVTSSTAPRRTGRAGGLAHKQELLRLPPLQQSQPPSILDDLGFSSSSSSSSSLKMMMVDEIHMSSSSMIMAVAEPWVQPAIFILDPFFNLMSLAMLARVVISWYPEVNATQWWIQAVILPTEGLLRSVRNIVPPAFGVDITPVFWLAIFTFLHEILLGQQGLLIMKLKYGM